MADHTTPTVRTPECDKMLAVKDKSQAIGEFITWLREKGVVLAEYHEHTDACGSISWPECGIHSVQPVAYHYDIEQLLVEYFEIDMNKVDQEKRAILEDLRARAEVGP